MIGGKVVHAFQGGTGSRVFLYLKMANVSKEWQQLRYAVALLRPASVTVVEEGDGKAFFAAQHAAAKHAVHGGAEGAAGGKSASGRALHPRHPSCFWRDIAPGYLLSRAYVHWGAFDSAWRSVEAWESVHGRFDVVVLSRPDIWYMRSIGPWCAYASLQSTWYAPTYLLAVDHFWVLPRDWAQRVLTTWSEVVLTCAPGDRCCNMRGLAPASSVSSAISTPSSRSRSAQPSSTILASSFSSSSSVPPSSSMADSSALSHGVAHGLAEDTDEHARSSSQASGHVSGRRAGNRTSVSTVDVRGIWSSSSSTTEVKSLMGRPKMQGEGAPALSVWANPHVSSPADKSGRVRGMRGHDPRTQGCLNQKPSCLPYPQHYYNITETLLRMYQHALTCECIDINMPHTCICVYVCSGNQAQYSFWLVTYWARAFGYRLNYTGLQGFGIVGAHSAKSNRNCTIHVGCLPRRTALLHEHSDESPLSDGLYVKP